MVRSFEVRATKKELVCDLSRDLDRELIELQKEGWKILNVDCTDVTEYYFRDGDFKSKLFTIIASK